MSCTTRWSRWASAARAWLRSGSDIAGFSPMMYMPVISLRWTASKGSNEEAYLFQKLVRTGFGSNNVEHCTRLCHASSVAALLEGVGSAAVHATFNECKNSDFIIVIGANPTENDPVAATFFKQAAKRGA